MSDFNINSHLNNMGFGRGKQDNASDGTNEKSTIDALFDNAGKQTYTGAKLTGLPVNLTNVGEVGLQKTFGGDSEGITGKMIMPSIFPDMQGGFLAKLLHSIFVKNREITDLTAGVGGDASGSGSASGGDSGGSDFSGGGFADYNTATLGAVVNPASFPDYDFIPVSRADLGNFSPPAVGTGQSMGIELG